MSKVTFRQREWYFEQFVVVYKILAGFAAGQYARTSGNRLAAALCVASVLENVNEIFLNRCNFRLERMLRFELSRSLAKEAEAQHYKLE